MKILRCCCAVLGALIVSVTSAVSAEPAGAAVVQGTYAVTGFSPATVAAGTPGQAFVVTVANQSPPTSNDVIDTIKVTVPAGFTAVSGQGGSGFTASTSGNVVTFSGLLVPTASAALSVTATAPTAVGTYAWTTAATGTVGGVTGNGQDFANTGHDPSVAVVPAPASKLVFSTQPTTTKVNTPITPAVTVTAQDTYGNVVSTYTQAITLSMAFNPNTGTSTPPSGTALPVSATPSNGTATFSGVTITQTGLGYKLGASSGTLTAATSQPFDVPASATVCNPGSACDSGTVGSPANTTADVHLSSGSSSDLLTVTVGGSVKPPPCATAGSQWGQPAQFDNHDATRTATVTMTIADSLADSGPDNPSSYAVCYESTRPFTTSTGTPATQVGTMYYGTLARCSANGNKVPCVQSVIQTEDGPNDDESTEGAIQAVVAAQSGDPILQFGGIKAGTVSSGG